MTTAEQILVIFLSSALAIFLVIAIVAGLYVVKLLKTLQRVADKAEGFVNSAEEVGEMVKQTVGTLSFMKVIRGIVNFTHKKQRENNDKGEPKS